MRINLAARSTINGCPVEVMPGVSRPGHLYTPCRTITPALLIATRVACAVPGDASTTSTRSNRREPAEHRRVSLLLPACTPGSGQSGSVRRSRLPICSPGSGGGWSPVQATWWPMDAVGVGGGQMGLAQSGCTAICTSKPG